MIKLTNPLLLNGRIIPCDKVVGLDSEFEQKIVNAGNAIFMNEDLKEEVPEPVSKEDHQLDDEEEVPEPVSKEDHQLEDEEEVPEPVSKEDHQLEDEEEVSEPVNKEDHQLDDNNTPSELEPIVQETLNIGR